MRNQFQINPKSDTRLEIQRGRVYDNRALQNAMSCGIYSAKEEVHQMAIIFRYILISP
jgi:hypothetical protein